MEEKRYIKRKEKALSDGNSYQLAVSCNSLGDFYNQQGRYQNAVKEYQQEAELYAKLGKKLEMARAQRMVGEMFMLLCEFDKAKEHINIYLDTVKKLHNKVEEQRAYATLGRAHLLHGQSTSETCASTTLEQLRHAERSFLRSLLLIKELSGQISKLEQLDMQARCYLNIGVIKEHMEEFAESISYIEKAIKISKSHDIFELTHLCYISMSLLYFCKKNDSTLALRYCNLALEVAKRLPNKVKKICETLITKSDILIKEGDFASAKQILTKAYKKNTPDENDRNSIEKSLRIARLCKIALLDYYSNQASLDALQLLDELVTTSSVDYAKRKSIFEKLGDGCCHLQNYTKALEYYQQMLTCAQLHGETEKDLIPIYVSLYQTFKDNKQYDKALVYLWKEFELNKNVPAEAFSTLCAIAEVCEQQKQPFWTIQDIYQKAKQHAAKVDNKQERVRLERVVYVRLKRLMVKHKMNMLVEELEEEAKNKDIDLKTADEDSDGESDAAGNEQNTPDLGDDVCLDDLTDSDTSDLDESERPRSHRTSRGVRCLTIKRNNKGETQLHQACIAGNLELARRLLDQGHVVNVRDHAGWIPLHEACNHGFRDIVELLLDRGATVAINDKGGTSCDGITPLYDACSNGYLDVVELLLERGADATVKTDFGETCVNGLDKWRRSATLTDGEQEEYTQVRAKLLKPLSKVGICKDAPAPLTNANVEVEAEEPKESRTLRRELACEEEPTMSARRHNRSGDGVKALKDSNKMSRAKSASLEYKNVMEQLKRPHRVPTLNDDTYNDVCSTSSRIAKSRRSALLNTDEVDDDTWLIDDVGPERKRRRYFSSTNELSSFTAGDRPSTSKENLYDSANSTWERGTDVLTPEQDAFQVLLDAATGSSGRQRQKQAQKLRLSRSSSIGSNSSISLGSRPKVKQQASLLDSGFCRFRSESPISSEDSIDATSVANMRPTEPDSTTTSIHLHITSPMKASPIKVHAAPLLPTTVSFKIKVEDELLLVPIERKKLNDINIRWLAEEAARRYYNLVGLKPVLRLKTADGFAYEENDPVAVAVEQSMILATVLEWQISPLSQRYEEMCHQLDKDIQPEVHSVLECTQTSNTIRLEDFWLTPDLTEPIFKALLHQANLRVLDLSNNFMQNEGCRQLSKSLPTLKQLKALNLKGNFITSDGLEILFSGAGIDSLQELEELNLSQNPLGNGCLRLLHRFCSDSTSKSLQKLSLSNCGLTNLYDFDLCYYQLTGFDISFNQLNAECFRGLLAKLNACRLQWLNLSYCKSVDTDERTQMANAERIVQFFESGTCEKFRRIKLCGVHLSDANVYKLVQCLNKANDLELLDVTGNKKLSGAALQFVLDKIPQLRKLIAVDCGSFVDHERVQKLALLKHLPNFMSLTVECEGETLAQQLRNLWEAHWGEKAQAKFYNGHLLLYVNDKDLLG